jgi:CheY-like chemotaxis protein
MEATPTASVLVVEDDKDTRDVLRIVFEDEGYVVAEATDGLKALEVLRASASSLVVVLDLDLPQLDGIQLLRMVAEDASLAARHAFILLTAVSDKRFQEAKAVCAEFMVPVIAKPFELDSVLGAMDAAVHRLPWQS